MTHSSIEALPARSPMAVDRALDLVDTGFHTGQRVGDRHAEVVVHMAGQDDIFNALGVLTQIADTSRRIPQGTM